MRIKKVVPFNQALLEKWLWQYGCEEKALRRLVIELKYAPKVSFGVRRWGVKRRHLEVVWDHGCEEKALINSPFCPTS